MVYPHKICNDADNKDKKKLFNMVIHASSFYYLQSIRYYNV